MIPGLTGVLGWLPSRAVPDAAGETGEADTESLRDGRLGDHLLRDIGLHREGAVRLPDPWTGY